jgi:GNAT superfamily N-acetyltransferase
LNHAIARGPDPVAPTGSGLSMKTTSSTPLVPPGAAPSGTFCPPPRVSAAPAEHSVRPIPLRADGLSVRTLRTVTARELSELSEVLIDCVEGGASVSFMQPLTSAKAHAFWTQVAAGVERGERLLVVATDDENRIVGTVQVILNLPENQPHRGDVAKMLVHRRARRCGLGARLLAAAEEGARAAGKTLLVLDTVTGGDAERLYTRGSWQRCGDIPNFALWPDGRPCGTTIFYKALTREPCASARAAAC